MRTKIAFGGLLLGMLLLLPRAVVAGEKGLYRFMAGDNIRISVPSHSGWDQNLMVQPDGRIYYPLAGEISVVGMTVPELQERIRTALETQLEKPVVAVTLVSTRDGSGWITVLGAVNSSGRLEPRPDWTITEALAAAGIQPDADLTRVQLLRDGQLLRAVDLSKLRETGKIEETIPVRAGDIIVVPEAHRAPVAVLGQVVKPGVVEWKKGLTVLDALNACSGATPKADLAGGQLARGGATQALDMEALLKGDHALNIELQPSPPSL
jgi:polysaccharide export outer membrane protein